MKDYEEMQMMYLEKKGMINIHLETIKYHQDREDEFYLGNTALISEDKYEAIDIHLKAIKYHQGRIDDLNSTTIEDEFYLGNSEFPDYPGNEWMKETDK